MINVHNGEKYLEEAIQSALDQSYADFELVIWDNASTDRTSTIASQFASIDKRVKVFRSETKTNLYDARNHAVDACSGQYVAFLDCDDVWIRDKLEVALRILSEEAASIFFSNFVLLDSEGIYQRQAFCSDFPTRDLEKVLSQTYVVALSTLVIELRALKLIGGFRPQFNILGDFDLVMRLASLERFCSSQRPLVGYRIHGENLSRMLEKSRFREIRDWFAMSLSDGVIAERRLADARASLELDAIRQTSEKSQRYLGILAFCLAARHWPLLFSKVRWKLSNLLCRVRSGTGSMTSHGFQIRGK